MIVVRVVHCFCLIFDATFIDPLRAEWKYPKRLSMKWRDFWRLTK